MTANNMSIKGRVNEFLVWRAGSSVDWDCTIKDIADEIGLTEPAVRNILVRKGWRDRVADGINGNWDRLAVDQAMRNTYLGTITRF